MPAEFALSILLRLILYVYFVYIYVYIFPACVFVGMYKKCPESQKRVLDL